MFCRVLQPKQQSTNRISYFPVAHVPGIVTRLCDTERAIPYRARHHQLRYIALCRISPRLHLYSMCPFRGHRTHGDNNARPSGRRRRIDIMFFISSCCCLSLTFIPYLMLCNAHDPLSVLRVIFYKYFIISMFYSTRISKNN